MIIVLYVAAYLATGIILAIVGYMSCILDEKTIMYTIFFWPFVTIVFLIVAVFVCLQEFVVWAADKLEDWLCSVRYSRKQKGASYDDGGV